jgi:hypothetical protein
MRAHRLPFGGIWNFDGRLLPSAFFFGAAFFFAAIVGPRAHGVPGID